MGRNLYLKIWKQLCRQAPPAQFVHGMKSVLVKMRPFQYQFAHGTMMSHRQRQNKSLPGNKRTQLHASQIEIYKQIGYD